MRHALPRLLPFVLVLGIVSSVLIALSEAAPLLWPHPVPSPVTTPLPQPTSASIALDLAIPDTPLGVITAYVQTSASAGRAGQPTALLPFLDPQGSAFAEVEAAFRQHTRDGETHDPQLTRWGIVQQTTTNERATITTLEQWDDTTVTAGQVTASLRGQLARHTYTLTRTTTTRWQITAIVTDVLVR